MKTVFSSGVEQAGISGSMAVSAGNSGFAIPIHLQTAVCDANQTARTLGRRAENV